MRLDPIDNADTRLAWSHDHSLCEGIGMRLLLVEDDSLLGEAVHAALGVVGHATDWVRTAGEAHAALRAQAYDCVLLDLGLPDEPGTSVLRGMRSRQDATPVIIITARGRVRDRIEGLDIGANDYLVKPFDLDELAARIRSVVRSAAASRGAQALEVGPLRLDIGNRTATWHGQAVDLTRREFWLLEALMRNRDRILSRSQLEETLYGWGDEISSNAVEVYVHHLRRKLEPGLIRTVRGAGYKLDFDHGSP